MLINRKRSRSQTEFACESSLRRTKFGRGFAGGRIVLDNPYKVDASLERMDLEDTMKMECEDEMMECDDEMQCDDDIRIFSY